VSDYLDMHCDLARELLSAGRDGELGRGERRALEMHVGQCPRCRAYAADLEHLDRRLRIAGVPDIPDLTPAIAAQTAPPEPPGAARALRMILLGSAFGLLALALPQLLAESHHGGGYRHLAAFDFAIAAGLVWCGLRPRHTLSGFLPMATVLVVACIGVTLADGSATVHLGNHVVAVVGLVAAWLLEVRPRRADGRLRLA
jgi:anti-sigma factor RsiW